MKPIKPTKPNKPSSHFTTELSLFSGEGPIRMGDYPPDSYVRYQSIGDEYEDEIILEVFTKELTPNPKYEKQLAEYEEAMILFTKKMEVFETETKLFEKEIAERTLSNKIEFLRRERAIAENRLADLDSQLKALT